MFSKLNVNISYTAVRRLNAESKMKCIHPLGSLMPRMYFSRLCVGHRKSAKKIGLAGLVNCGKDKYNVGPCTLCSVYWGGGITSNVVSVKFPEGVTKVMED